MSDDLKLILKTIDALDETDPRQTIPAIQAERQKLLLMAARLVSITERLPETQKTL